MLEETILNFQITILLILGTVVFSLVNLKRKDLTIYLPSYIILPIGYLFIYLQVFDSIYRLVGNLFFLIGIIAFISAVYYEYFKALHETAKRTGSSIKNSTIILIFSSITGIIMSIQIVFSLLLLISMGMFIKLLFVKRSTKHASLVIFQASALLSAISTILSYFNLPGVWEFSFVAMFIFGTCYFVFPIFIFLEGKLIESQEKALESEEKYRLISENANDLIALLNNKYEHEYINEYAYGNILGYSKGDLIGSSVWEIVHPEDLKRIVSSRGISTSEIEVKEGEYKEEVRFRHKDGHFIWLDLISKVFVDTQGDPKVIVISRDITERKKAEQLLKESEEKFRTITEQSFIGAVIEQDFDLKYVNPQFAKMLGYSSDDLLAWKITDFFKILHPDDLDRIKELIDNKTKDLIQDIESFQFRLFKKTGEIIWLELFLKAIHYQTRPGNLIFIRDITESIKARKIIENEMDRLKKIDKLRKELITRISHELRTPLTSMYGATQILLKSQIDDYIEEIWPYIEILHRGSLRLKELVDNLLDASLLDNYKYEIRRSNENLNSIIKDCVKELNYLAESRELTLATDLSYEIYLNLDKIRITQVLVNIISNAIKNTPPHGNVFINVNETNDFVDIIVRDTGVGITKEERQILFQRFGKIERYGQELDVDIEGAGLGLYISKEIVELHGGKILVESEGRNKGSSFIIRLNKEG
ncbi:MAG: PAS domain S-box protein [Promethearchaeota archaeon]